MLSCYQPLRRLLCLLCSGTHLPFDPSPVLYLLAGQADGSRASPALRTRSLSDLAGAQGRQFEITSLASRWG